MEYYSIRQIVEELNENKKRINIIVQDMDQKRRDYEASLVPLKERFRTINAVSSQLGSQSVSVKLGDLLDEICWLTQTNVEDLDVSLSLSVSLDGAYDMDDFLTYIDNGRNCGMRFSLSNDNKKSDNQYVFSYLTTLTMELDSIQADGKTLLEHCSTIINRRRSGRQFTELVINKDIENVMLDLNLNLLSMDTNASWKPADLFTQAVLNCVERKNNTKVDKIRQRINK